MCYLRYAFSGFFFLILTLILTEDFNCSLDDLLLKSPAAVI